MGETTYFQKNRETILNRTKDYYESNKEVLREKQKISITNYLKKRRIQKESMEEIDIKICFKKRNLKKRNKDQRSTKKIIVKLRKLKCFEFWQNSILKVL